MRAIVGDVVALAYKANATLAVVSNHTYYWNPGEYSVDSVLSVAEFGGTQYETLIPLLQQDWDEGFATAIHLSLDLDTGQDGAGQVCGGEGGVHEPQHLRCRAP